MGTGRLRGRFGRFGHSALIRGLTVMTDFEGVIAMIITIIVQQSIGIGRRKTVPHFYD